MTRFTFILRIFACLIGLLLIAGCSEPDIQVAIRVEDATLSADELLAIAQAQNEFASATQLQLLARTTAEQLAAERRLLTEGWDSDPQFIQAKRRFISAFVNARINEQLSESLTVSDEEVARYFAAHLDQYRQPTQIRIALIELSAKTHGATAENVANEIHQALAQIPDATQRNRRFNEYVVATSSHLASRYQGGDIGYLQRDDTNWPTELIDAVFTATMDSPLGPIVKTPDAFYLFRLLARREAVEPELAQVAENIRNKIVSDKHDKIGQQGRELLVKGIDIEIDEDVIKRIARPDQDMARTLPATPAG